MTTPSGQITANDVNQELGRLVVPFSGAAVSTVNDRITVSSDYIGYGNRLANGDAVVYVSNSGTGIGGLSNNTTYYVIEANNTTLRLSATPGGANVNITSTGTGTKYLTRTSSPINLNDERVRRLAGVTSGQISFDNLRSKNITKTYDSGTVTSSKLRDAGLSYNFTRLANGSYRAYHPLDNNSYGVGAVDYFCLDTSAYANASIQSGNLSVTIRASYDQRYVDTFNTNFAVICFLRNSTYNTTIEPNPVSVPDYSNQNDLYALSNMINTTTVSNIVTGDVVLSYPLQTSVTFGTAGGWSYGGTGQWNTGKIADTLHAVTISINFTADGSGNNYPLQIHSCRINGSYTL